VGGGGLAVLVPASDHGTRDERIIGARIAWDATSILVQLQHSDNDWFMDMARSGWSSRVAAKSSVKFLTMRHFMADVAEGLASLGRGDHAARAIL
jgi:hypothetical protein